MTNRKLGFTPLQYLKTPDRSILKKTTSVSIRLRKKTRTGAGFTLIESLAVIAIIGVLITLAATVSLGAQRNSRDAERKNDLYAISQGFDARAIDRTCTNQDVVGQYPRVNSSTTSWVKVSLLQASNNIQNNCADFSEYLKTIPEDPQSPKFSYYYNISGAPVLAKHYRLAASLERSSVTQAACQQASQIWVATPGTVYDCVTTTAIGTTADTREYQYYIGK